MEHHILDTFFSVGGPCREKGAMNTGTRSVRRDERGDLRLEGLPGQEDLTYRYTYIT